MSSLPPPVIEARNLEYSYILGGVQIPVLKGVDLVIRAGERASLVGKSGAGKSTLLQILGLLEPPSSGELLLDGRDVAKLSRSECARVRRNTIGFVFQFYHLIRELSALENVLLAGRIGSSLTDFIRNGRSERARANALLDRVGLAARAKHRPSQLSGGEQQRVAIARAIFARPKLLLCDEPTGNLDAETGASILELLFEIQRELGTALLLVTHDPELSARCEREIRLVNGRVAKPANSPE